MTQSIEERRIDFICTQFQPYIDNPLLRAVTSDGQCRYQDPDTGNKCLIGKQIPKEIYSTEMEGFAISFGVNKEVNNTIYTCLPSSIQELGIAFLTTMQYLHDNETYWTPNFNELGQRKLYNTIATYCKQTKKHHETRSKPCIHF
jgi:hypothetical protein